MKKLILVTLSIVLFFVIPYSFADVTYKRVISVNPIYETYHEQIPITRYREVCREKKSKGNTIVGAIIGGVIGNQFGSGSGREISTSVGAALGAQAGASDKITECRREPYTDYVTEKRNHVSYYRVTVEGGKVFHTSSHYRVGQIVTIRMSIE